MADFVHLHAHSQYSLLEGAIRVKDLCKRTAELGMKAVALTDHNNMHGAIDFYKRAKENGVKAILGCELGFVFPNDHRLDAKGVDRTPTHHLVLLARNMVGYKNLIALVSEAWLEAPEGASPRSTLEKLSRKSQGLIVLTGCLGGFIPQAILNYSPQQGKELLGQLRDACEKGSLWVELQDHGLVEQPIVNRILVEQAKDLGLGYVATNDAHYLRREDSIAFRLLGCISSGTSLDEADRHDHGSTEMYLKSEEEMAARFADYPEALRNTQAVFEMIEKVDPTSKPMLPKFRDEGGQVIPDVDQHFAKLSREGLDRRFEKARKLGVTLDEKAYRDRLEIEISVIVGMGFPGYFLIVQDFINWGKANGVPVGPGRGSGAGSLVAYALGITDLDPIPYNLLFERFLNPERVSMPDFDVDFCMLKREKVIEYVRQKYGTNSVGQIATFQMLKSKSVVRDVGRAIGLPYADVDAIAKLVPEPVQGKSVTIAEAMEKEPRLKAMHDEDASTRQLLGLAQKLENLNRHAGMHAAGIVISEGPLWETVPVFRGNGGEIVTQFAKEEVEYAGLVKFDFLGLTTLTVLDIAVNLINKRPDFKARVAKGEPFDLAEIRLDDARSYQLLQSGETTGVFQLESSGMQKLFKDLRPTRFEDIVAAVALYRPGPLGTGMVEDFVARKNGKAKTEYPHPDLEFILQDTYGVITYQEQVMMIARKMGGYSLGGADLLRRAMGKKKAEEMAKQKSIFVEGAKKLNYDEGIASKIFDLLEYFAGYGFNKSHSAAYALITFHTAYLKTHFPVEFICATLTSDLGKIEKIIGTIAEGRSMGIPILPPDVNESERQFAVIYEAKQQAPNRRARSRVEEDPYRPRIRFGLGGVKGVGEGAVEAILEARQQGPFKDLFDFCARVDIRRVNRGVLEALVVSGAFDVTLERAGTTRAQAFAAIEPALERGKGAAKERASGQMGLFGATEILRPTGGYPTVENWDTAELLRRERGAIGFYLSGHPLDRYAKEVGRVSSAATNMLNELPNNTEITMAGVVESYREKVPKTGGRIAFFELEDRHGRVEVIVRPKLYAQLENKLDREAKQTVANTLLKEGETILMKGKVQIELKRDENGEIDESVDEGELERKVSLLEVVPLGEALRSNTKRVHLRLTPAHGSEKRWKELREALEKHRGHCPVSATMRLPGGNEVLIALPGALRVEPSEALLAQVERIFGEKVLELQ